MACQNKNSHLHQFNFCFTGELFLKLVHCMEILELVFRRADIYTHMNNIEQRFPVRLHD